MKKIKAIIIEDEVKASENLEFLIQSYCHQIDIVGIYHHPLEALPVIQKAPPDLLFLDVEMPQIDGFQLLELIGNTINCKVIFTTAYKDYALNAIKKSASDYLLKPIDIKELIKSVETVSLQIEKENIKSIEIEKPNLIKIASLNGYDFLKINEIQYLKSDNSVTTIYYIHDGIDKKVVATKSIKHFENTLQHYSFFRVHDSYIVNLEKIKQYTKGDGGSIIMNDGYEIFVSRRRKQDFLDKFLN